MNVGPIAFLPGAGSGAEALERLAAGTFDLVALHLNLPDGDGFAVGRKIRARSVMPIMMVTGKGDTIDRVVGLERGADDDTAKPFSCARWRRGGAPYCAARHPPPDESRQQARRGRMPPLSSRDGSWTFPSAS
jgi:DNA-binding NtrC family response regulator